MERNNFWHGPNFKNKGTYVIYINESKNHIKLRNVIVAASLR
jgi:hypothetical protein